MKIVNLTPHNINVITGDITTTYESKGVARVSQSTKEIGKLDGHSVSFRSFGSVEGLPAFKLGTYYIVSVLVLQACSDRCDLVIPGDLVRNEAGNIIGCKGFYSNELFS